MGVEASAGVGLALAAGFLLGRGEGDGLGEGDALVQRFDASVSSATACRAAGRLETSIPARTRSA